MWWHGAQHASCGSVGGTERSLQPALCAVRKAGAEGRAAKRAAHAPACPAPGTHPPKHASTVPAQAGAELFLVCQQTNSGHAAGRVTSRRRRCAAPHKPLHKPTHHERASSDVPCRRRGDGAQEPHPRGARPCSQSTNQSINQPINQSINQSINLEINQPVNQSVNQSVSRVNSKSTGASRGSRGKGRVGSGGGGAQAGRCAARQHPLPSLGSEPAPLTGPPPQPTQHAGGSKRRVCLARCVCPPNHHAYAGGGRAAREGAPAQRRAANVGLPPGHVSHAVSTPEGN